MTEAGRADSGTGTEDTGATEVALMIVGTPRSGTTLVQRVVAETSGLPTVPETHLFTVFAPRLLRQVRFPLEGPVLLDALTAYGRLRQHQGGAPPPERLFDRLGGRADDLVAVFLAVVAELSSGARRVVEKTPDHLLWVPYLAPVMERTRFVAVVRDPRAVYASTAQVHWGQRNAAMAAERWACDQRHLLAVADRFGSERVLMVRYEDLLVDESTVRKRLASFAGAVSEPVTESVTGPVAASQVFRPHELAWKHLVSAPVDQERSRAWEKTLSPETVAVVERVCGPEMAVLGYSSSSARGGRHLSSDFDRLRYRIRRQGHELRIRHRYVPRAGLG